MPESLPMKTRLLLAGASLQLISLAKKSEKKEKKQKVVAVSAGMTLSKLPPNLFDRTNNFVGRLPTSMHSRRDLAYLRLLLFRAPLKILSSDSPRSALAALAKKSENRDN